MTSANEAARRIMALRHARAVALLPFMNTLLIPGLILVATREAHPLWARVDRPLDLVAIAAASLVLAAGFAVTARAILLFVRKGNGTLAPWDPTQTLIRADLYRYSRNPMKAGLFLILTAESVLLGSVFLAGWTAAFIAANVVYIRVSEEPGLRERFGAAYDDYCADVPRWLPPVRLRRRTGAATTES
jgi:protein-S-isoprenylcysteine O-methyltransferase Ste14